MGNEWLIGVALSLSGSVLSNLGVNLQKLNHVKNNQAADGDDIVVLPAPENNSNHNTSDESGSDPDENGRKKPGHGMSRGVSAGSIGAHSYSVSGNMAHFVRRMKREAEEKHKDGDEVALTDQQQQQANARGSVSANDPHELIDVKSGSWKDLELAEDSTSDEENDKDEDASAGRTSLSDGGVRISIERNGDLRSVAPKEAAKEEDSNQGNYCLQPLWILGFACVTAGAVADLTALGFASQTVVAPLGASTLVSNLWFAPCFSQEKLTRQDIIATMIIVAGCALSVGFASHNEQEYSFDELFAFYSSSQFFFYGVVIGTTVFAVWNSIRHMEEGLYEYILQLDRGEQMQEEHIDRVDGVLKKLAQYNWGRKLLLQFTRFGYAAISGVIGAQSVVFAKGAALAVREGFPAMFLRYQTYLILVAMFTCVFLQIKWLNMGLEQFDALYVVPVFQAFWIAFAVLGGLIVYNEAAAMSSLQMFLFALGVLICLRGVIILSRRQANTQEEKRITVLHLASPRGSSAYDAAVAAAVFAAGAAGDAASTVLSATAKGATTAFHATKDLTMQAGQVIGGAGSRLIRRLSNAKMETDQEEAAEVDLPTITE